MTNHCKRFAAWMLVLTLLAAIFPGCGRNRDVSDPDVSTHPPIPMVLRATVASRELELHSEPRFDAPVVSMLLSGDTVIILEQNSLEGVSWGRTEAGWICMDFVSLEEIPATQIQDPQPSETEAPGKNYLYDAKIIVDRLNIRSGPGTKTEKVGEYFWNDSVQILEEEEGWGRTELGWISLTYTYAEGHPDNLNAPMEVRASRLNLRMGPGTAYETLGELVKGDDVTILKTGTFGGRTWGYTGTGWLSMDYLVPIG